MTISAMASPLVAGALPVNLRQVARDARMRFPASMRDLLGRRPFARTVRLRLVYVEPTPTFTVTPRTVRASWTTQLLRMRQIYATAGIGVEVVGTETWSDGNASMLTDLDVGSDRTGTAPDSPRPCAGAPSTEQELLYAHRDGMAENDVAIYRVRSLLPAFNGCATHPDGVPGAAVADTATQWTLAHEVGHVLGLRHADSGVAPCALTRLMTGCGTGMITGVPTLDVAEIDTMRRSDFLVAAP